MGSIPEFRPPSPHPDQLTPISQLTPHPQLSKTPSLPAVSNCSNQPPPASPRKASRHPTASQPPPGWIPDPGSRTGSRTGSRRQRCRHARGAQKTLFIRGALPTQGSNTPSNPRMAEKGQSPHNWHLSATPVETPPATAQIAGEGMTYASDGEIPTSNKRHHRPLRFRWRNTSKPPVQPPTGGERPHGCNWRMVPGPGSKPGVPVPEPPVTQ